MKKALALLLSISLIATSLIIPSSAKVTGNDSLSSGYTPNEILVRIDSERVKSAVPDFGALKIEKIDTSSIEEGTGGNGELLKLTVENGSDIEALCEELSAREDVIAAEPNYIYSIDSVEIPSEAEKSGDKYLDYNWYRDSLGIVEAWQKYDTLGSEETVVAVIDTGVNAEHKDLKGSMWSDENGNHGWNAVDDSHSINDTNGHGTNVAGIIAMQANDFGYVGIAPKVKIMGCKASNGSGMTDENIIECLEYAIENGADIINMSFGGTALSPISAELYQKASLKALLIAAAGNSGLDAANVLHYPAAYSGILGVMSYGSYADDDRITFDCDKGELSDFSNYDSTGYYYTTSAPGVDILGPSCKNNEDFSPLSGTSQAAPIVTGVAALYLSLHPQATPYQIRKAIEEGSVKQAKGYYDDRQYPLIDVDKILSLEPKPVKEIQLSDNAKKLMNRMFETELESFTEAHSDSVSIVFAKYFKDTGVPVSTVAELKNAICIELSSLELNNEDVEFFKTAEFKKLNRLDFDCNENISSVSFGSGFAPNIKFVYCEKCSLSDLADFTSLKSLAGLSAYENGFETTLPLREFEELEIALLSSCRLKDLIGVKGRYNIGKLDVSYNYISDITPLLDFHGYNLDISGNPISKGRNYSGFIKDIRKSMNYNTVPYSAIKFTCSYLNGSSEKEYIDCERLSLAKNAFSKENSISLRIKSYPENANMNNICLFYSEDIEIDERTGEILTPAESLPDTATVKIVPTSKYPAFTEQICFTDAASNEGRARIISAAGDKETYGLGDTAVITVKTNSFAEYLLAKDTETGAEIVITPESRQGDYNYFRFEESLNLAGDYRFKLYCSNSESFGIGATALDLQVETAVREITLNSAHTGELHLSYDNTLTIEPVFYPENAVIGREISFESLDESIATVDDNGVVTAVDYGDTAIRVTNDRGLEEYFFINVARPAITNVAVNAGAYDQPVTITCETSGAEEIAIVDESGNSIPVDSASYSASSYDGFDRSWTVKASFNRSDQVNAFVYALDKNGLDANKSRYQKISFTAEIPIESFEITSESTVYKRTDKNITLGIDAQPLDANSKITWSTSTPSVVTLKGTGYTCEVTPCRTGTATIMASALINGKRVYKNIQLTFTEGGVTGVSAPENVIENEEFIAEIHTSKDIDYLTVEDGFGFGEEFSDYHFYRETEAEKIWSVPCRASSADCREFTITCGDSVGNLSNVYTFPINCEARAEDYIYIDCYARVFELGDSASFNVFSKPDGENVTASCSFSLSDSSIAHIDENNLICFDKPGEVTLTAEYNGMLASRNFRSVNYISGIIVDDVIRLAPGEEKALEVTYEPENHSDEVDIYSDNESIVTVENGVLTAVSEGEANIIIKAKSGAEKSVKIVVTVLIPGESIAFDKETYECDINGSITANLNIQPVDCNEDIAFEIGNSRIAKVDESGVITPVASGKTTVTAILSSGLIASAKVVITDNLRLELSRTDVRVRVGSLLAITAFMSPGNHPVSGEFYSDNYAVASVTSGGVVYAKETGVCNIYFVSDKGLISSCRIEAYNSPVNNLITTEEETINLKVYDNYFIETICYPAYAEEKPVWTSNDESIATVTADGIVTACNAGTAIVTAAVSKGMNYEFTIIVTAAEADISGVSDEGNHIELTDLAGNCYTAETNPNFENIPFGTYEMTIIGAHRTSLVIKDIGIKGDINLGEVRLFNGDVNGDNLIDIADLNEVSSRIGIATPDNQAYDINDDGTIDIADISIILSAENYGQSGKIIIY